MAIDIRHGDCLEVMRTLPDCSVDSIVTDPPYGLAFMGKRWDYDVPSVEVWQECLRVLKPGGHLLAFAGTRTQHRMAVRIEDAGFEIRDMIAWVYGSGFPKSLDVSKAIDRMDASEEQERRRLRFTAWVRSTGVTSRQIDEATGTNMGGHYTTAASQPAIMTREHLEQCRHLLGDVPEWVEREADIRSVESRNMAEREVVVEDIRHRNSTAWETKSGMLAAGVQDFSITAPATPEAKQWQGWGTALKPALEPITMARKPLATSCTNVLGVIECQLRERGVTGDILWKPENASGAAKSKKTRSLGSTRPSEPSVTFAKTAAENETQKTGLQTPKSSGMLGTSGIKQIPEGNESFRERLPETCGYKLLQPMVESASAAEKPNLTSSLSTTSTEEEHSTGKKSTEKSMPTCGVKDSRPDTESFAGIATGLTGSMATVHISRDSDGMFLWPAGLPEIVPGKPLTVAANVLTHGTGAINVDGCRVGTEVLTYIAGETGGDSGKYGTRKRASQPTTVTGRWPANLVHDGSDEVLGSFPNDGDSTAARFFYCPKADQTERGDGNNHPTVKPVDLMRYLVRLVTREGGTVLEPFGGSGTTAVACVHESCNCIIIERENQYVEIIKQRIAKATQQQRLF